MGWAGHRCIGDPPQVCFAVTLLPPTPVKTSTMASAGGRATTDLWTRLTGITVCPERGHNNNNTFGPQNLNSGPQIIRISSKIGSSRPSQSSCSPSWAALGPGVGSGLLWGGPHALKYGKKQQTGAFWNAAADAGDWAEVVSRTAARTPLPHAPGARMTR